MTAKFKTSRAGITMPDAIEIWAVTNRDQLDRDQKDLLRQIWSRVRKSDLAETKVDGMTADHRSAVVALFESGEQAQVEEALRNIKITVRRQPKPTRSKPTRSKPTRSKEAKPQGAAKPAVKAEAAVEDPTIDLREPTASAKSASKKAKAPAEPTEQADRDAKAKAAFREARAQRAKAEQTNRDRPKAESAPAKPKPAKPKPAKPKSKSKQAKQTPAEPKSKSSGAFARSAGTSDEADE